jgi:serine/threonine-protein kinase
MAHINEQPPALPGDIPEPVSALVMSCIAKKPADRPATAANLARAAQALRRGDVAAATVAVPAIAAGGTVAFNPPQTPGNDAATALIGTQAGAVAGGPGTPGSPVDGEDEEPKKKRAWIWWVVGIVAVLIIAGVVGAFALNSNGQPEPTKSATTRSATPKPSNTPTPSPTETRVTVNSADFVGLSVADAQAKLEALNLTSRVEDGDPAPKPEQANTVQSISPTGSLAPGSLVVLQQYTAQPTVNQPNSASPGAVSADGVVTFSWAAATCPTGYTVSSYAYTITGGKDASSQTSGTLDADHRSVTVQIDKIDTSASLSYTVTCGNLAASAASEAASSDAWQATDEPTTDPTDGNNPSAGPQDGN